MIRGIDVVLHEPTLQGYDDADKEIYTTNAVTVPNVLVAPSSIAELPENINLDGVKAIYKLAIPKGDTHEWRNSSVDFFGETFTTLGAYEEGIEHLIPLHWNRKITAVKYG